MKVYAVVGAKYSESGTPLTPILSQYGLKSSLEKAKEELQKIKEKLQQDIDEEYLDIEEDETHLDITDGDYWYVFNIIETEIDYKD